MTKLKSTYDTTQQFKLWRTTKYWNSDKTQKIKFLPNSNFNHDKNKNLWLGQNSNYEKLKNSNFDFKKCWSKIFSQEQLDTLTNNLTQRPYLLQTEIKQLLGFLNPVLKTALKIWKFKQTLLKDTSKYIICCNSKV